MALVLSPPSASASGVCSSRGGLRAPAAFAVTDPAYWASCGAGNVLRQFTMNREKWTSNFRSPTIRASLAYRLIQAVSIRWGTQQNKREQADALLSH
jgi:hypothetical protein